MIMLKRNILSIFTAAVILYLSLSSSDKFDKTPFWNIPGFDKIVHFMMYFFLMSVIVFENRYNIKYNTRLYLIGLIPVIYGGLMEILQLLFTNTRSASFFDFIADAAGVICSILLCFLLKPVRKVLFRS